MKLIKTKFDSVFIIEPEVFNDNRGSFVKIFNGIIFNDFGIKCEFKEIFYSISEKNVIRGMHFQEPPYDTSKIVHIIKGASINVLLDISKKSKTYGQFISVVLSEKNKQLLYIPAGFAHGFLSLSNKTNMVYTQSSIHSPVHDKGILWNSFGMDWGIKDPILSDRDKRLVAFNKFESPFN